MFGTFGSQQFGAPWFIPPAVPGIGGNISLLGDTSTHGGVIITSNQDGTFLVGGVEVAVNGAQLSCPEHGLNVISAIVSKSFHNGKLILTHGAKAGCGATIISPDRKVYVEVV